MGKVLGVEENWPPGTCIETARKCDNREFCQFFDYDAINAGSDHEITLEKGYICCGCNDELSRDDFELVDQDELNRSRVAQGGSEY